MCERCDYGELLHSVGLRATEHRLTVLQVVGAASAPLTARDVYQAVQTDRPINRVTVYRVLDSLVESGLVEKMSAGDRTFRYGLAPNEHHPRHAHFFCRRCGLMTCLPPETLPIAWQRATGTLPGVPEKVEIRVDGICDQCLESRELVQK
ncbi:Fur family transcriptional regulator, ferric uptake regulator [Desulfacinum hydrothermale DSM 13146]|uniref:Fur family transcriptional regulator, ferric uptake regulator n=1 Tax=Desulfacinum hydrothermale DSM 13146 TaxID=1121390 RepID=A0A1W1XIR4_9BACT|nr:Fur family transcriptional regulator [Desulfacinum hydrothermale]SMC23717.1 Fur family transcriptional regulator, ferric uptake regulator [Desulfacinum hydrothermale DSM 13146]